MTVRDFIARAFTTGKIKHPGDSIPATEMNNALEVWNELLDAWRNAGVNIGVGNQTLESEVTIPSVARRTVRFALARDLMAEWGVPFDPEIASVAVSGYSQLLMRRSRPAPAQFDICLPGPHGARGDTLRDQLF